MNTYKNACDYGHETNETVRRLPISEGSAIIVCYRHYCQEMNFRRERNKELGDFCKFDLPSWESLEVYEAE